MSDAPVSPEASAEQAKAHVYHGVSQTRTQWLNSLAWTPVDKSEFKKASKDEQLMRIRHSSAHVLAAALQKLRANISFAIGPATATGYFYDVKPDAPLREEDLVAIQAEMDKIANRSHPFEVASVAKAEAIELFKELGQTHKVEIMARIPSETVTLYRTGDFLDLCAGPHVPHTGLCRFSKVLGLSASHWHGEELPSLTRVTGTAWANDKDLNKYLEFMEESKARDHRVMGPKLGLFSFHPWATGALWHPAGVTLRNNLLKLWHDMIDDEYVEILNPQLYRQELFETSGHWDHFQENMFIFKGECEHEPALALKPMNCPDTMLFFKSQVRSYRELPLRVAEGQILHRNEATGAMHGLMRTRNFVQDDAHLFVATEHIQKEISSLLTMIDRTYKLFDLPYKVHLSTRPESFMGEIETWNDAEAGLKAALEAANLPFVIDEGEGAFYGPKIDVYVTDSLGRQWQCGTVQLDFQLPERFELTYVAQDGSHQRPIVIHRAVFGSFERFMGILIEHLGGAFPTWLSPTQATVLPIGEAHHDYAKTVVKKLKSAGIRAVLSPDDTINYRVRNAEMAKIPYILVVGDREQADGTVSIRTYSGGRQGVKSIDDFLTEIQQKVAERVFDVEVKSFAHLFIKDDTPTTEDAEY